MRALTTLVAALALAGVAQAATGEGAQLAAALRKPIQKVYKGYVFTKISCVVPSTTAKKATCNAFFTHKAQGLKGDFQIAVTIDRSTGNISWRATSATCIDLASGKAEKC